MSYARHLLSLVIALGIAACSTPYQATFLSGGYSEKQLEPEVWQIEFGGNGLTTQETVQTYWLYRSAQLTLEKGYDGFEIVSNTNLVLAEPPSIEIAAAAGGGAHYTYHPVYIPMYTGGDSGPKYTVNGNIRLLRAPIQAKPPKVFDAAQLKTTLEPYVNGNKCDVGNVCAHVHRYLMPDTQTASTDATATSTAPTTPSAAAQQTAVARPTAASVSGVGMRPPSPQQSPAQSFDRVSADFPEVVEFRCPGAGTQIRTSVASEFKFTEANGTRCGYVDENGQTRERYALFADGISRLARKEMDSLWPLRVRNRVDFDIIDSVSDGWPARFLTRNRHETFEVTQRQRIAVPAGIFDTFIVEWTEREIGVHDATEAKITMWYAPAVGYVVKSTVSMINTNAGDPHATAQYANLSFEAAEIAMPNGVPVPVAAKPTPKPSATQVVAPGAVPTSTSPADRLIALKRLLDEKLITREEYDARRKAILDGL